MRLVKFLSKIDFYRILIQSKEELRKRFKDDIDKEKSITNESENPKMKAAR